MEYEGDMEQILENVLCCTVDDEPRFAEILTDLVNKEELPEYQAFTKENKKQKTGRRKKVLNPLTLSTVFSELKLYTGTQFLKPFNCMGCAWGHNCAAQSFLYTCVTKLYCMLLLHMIV